jgi:hypothetical protein
MKWIPKLIFSLFLTLVVAFFLQVVTRGFVYKLDDSWCNSCFEGMCTFALCSPKISFNYPSLLILIPIFIIFIFLFDKLSKKINISKITILTFLFLVLVFCSARYYGSWVGKCRAATYKPDLPVKRGVYNCPYFFSSWTWSNQ